VNTQRLEPKVLLLSPQHGIGGSERILLTLARGLIRRGIAVQTVLAAVPGVEQTLEWFRQEGVQAEASAAMRPLEAPRTRQDMASLRRLVRASSAGVVHLHYGGNYASFKDVMAVRAAGRKRCILTLHNASPLTDARQRQAMRLSAWLSHAVTVPSDALRQVLVEAGVPASKVYLVPNGVPVPQAPPSRAEARSRLGLPPDAFVLSAVARLIPEKGLAELIEAVARIPDPRHEIRLVLAGEGPAQADLEAQARRQLGDRACFLGRVLDIGVIYAASDVFALPSHMESFGLVFIEAALYGVPSIGTAVGGIPDTVADGKTGLLVPVRAPDALAEAIRRLRDDPALRRRLGEAARARAYEEFSDRRMVERYAQIYWPHTAQALLSSGEARMPQSTPADSPPAPASAPQE